jgi:hypothetical protein
MTEALRAHTRCAYPQAHPDCGMRERYRYRADMHIHAVRVAVAALIPSG